jgi:hypothetical protein
VVWIINLELQGCSSPVVSIKACVGWVLLTKLLIMYWRIWDLWGLANLVVLRVTETEAILPYLMGVHQDRHGPPMNAYRGIASKTCTRVR